MGSHLLATAYDPTQFSVRRVDELLAIARKVADLDMMLLTDLPGCEALPPVRVMVISFAAAWAGDDLPLSLEQPLAWVAERTAGSNGAAVGKFACLAARRLKQFQGAGDASQAHHAVPILKSHKLGNVLAGVGDLIRVSAYSY